MTSLGNTVEVSGGSYGWQIDQEGGVQCPHGQHPECGDVTREPQYARRAASHEGNDFGSSYVEIDLTNQQVWVYVNGTVRGADALRDRGSDPRKRHAPGRLSACVQTDEHHAPWAEKAGWNI